MSVLGVGENVYTCYFFFFRLSVCAWLDDVLVYMCRYALFIYVCVCVYEEVADFFHGHKRISA